MFFNRNRKEEKPVTRVTAIFRRNGVQLDERTILVPEGYTFTHEFAERPALIDAEGKIVRSWDWQPGWEVEYQFHYDRPEEQGDAGADPAL